MAWTLLHPEYLELVTEKVIEKLQGREEIVSEDDGRRQSSDLEAQSPKPRSGVGR